MFCFHSCLWMIQKPASFHEFPAYMNEKPASFASKVTSIKNVLRQVRFWYPLLLIIPISDFLLYPSHTCLSVSYSVCSCEGCEGCPFFWLNPSDCPFFSLERKEPKVQGSHYGGYGLGRCAKISENSLRSDNRDFLTLHSVDRLTPPPLGRNNWKLRIDNWKFIRPDYMGYLIPRWVWEMRVEEQRAAPPSQCDRIKQ